MREGTRKITQEKQRERENGETECASANGHGRVGRHATLVLSPSLPIATSLCVVDALQRLLLHRGCLSTTRETTDKVL